METPTTAAAAEQEQTAKQLLDSLVEGASERIGELNGQESPAGIPLRYAGGFSSVVTQYGRIHCDADTTDKHYRNRRHVRARFKLNGKVISRTNLEIMLTRKESK